MSNEYEYLVKYNIPRFEYPGGVKTWAVKNNGGELLAEFNTYDEAHNFAFHLYSAGRILENSGQCHE